MFHPPHNVHNNSRRKCLYTGSSKFLVQVTDDVEAGDERMKELEHEMKEVGLFDSEFGLGDVLGEEIEDPNKVAPEAKTKPKKLPDFPTVEGQESLPEYIGQYKRACLNRKALLKSTKDRLIKDKAQGYENLGLHKNVSISCFWWICPFL